MATPVLSVWLLIAALAVGALLIAGVVAAVLIATMPKRERDQR